MNRCFTSCLLWFENVYVEFCFAAPYAPEPYQTLSMLYEDMGDPENAYQVPFPYTGDVTAA